MATSNMRDSNSFERGVNARCDLNDMTAQLIEHVLKQHCHHRLVLDEQNSASL